MKSYQQIRELLPRTIGDISTIHDLVELLLDLRLEVVISQLHDLLVRHHPVQIQLSIHSLADDVIEFQGILVCYHILGKLKAITKVCTYLVDQLVLLVLTHETLEPAGEVPVGCLSGHVGATRWPSVQH